MTVAAIEPASDAAVTGRGAGGPAPTRIVVAYGFWIFLLSDIVMFSALFATYAVQVHATAGGPTGAELFNQVNVAIETGCLLISSFTCGLMSLAIAVMSSRCEARLTTRGLSAVSVWMPFRKSHRRWPEIAAEPPLPQA